MGKIIKILINEDDPNDIAFILYALEKSGLRFETKLVHSEPEFMNALENFIPDIILSDYSLPSFDGPTAFQIKEKISPAVPFILVSGTIVDERAVELIKSGVTDYVLKDKLFTLLPKITRALKEADEKRDKIIADEKLYKANNLYAFISQVNQNIIRVTDEATLFRNSCRLALEFGKFKIAWIGLFDHDNKTISLVEQSGFGSGDLCKFYNAPYGDNGPQDYVLKTGKHFICNDLRNNLELQSWKPMDAKLEIHSCMVLPIKRDGRIIGTFNLYSTALNFSGAEEIKLLIEVADDISFALDLFEKERKQTATDELMIKNERRFRALIEKSTDMKTLSSLAGDFIYGSPSITKILGYTPEEVLEMNIFDCIHPDDAIVFLARRAELLETPDKPFYIQLRFKHKNGNWVWCEGTVTNLLEDPNIQALISNFRDISERKLAEENLLQSESRLNEAQAMSHIGNWEINFAGNIHTWSDELYHIFGIEKEEAQPSTELFLSFIHGDDLDDIKTKVENTFQSLEATSYHFRFIRKDGAMRYGYTERKFELDKNGKPMRLLGVVQDITDRKLKEEEREKMIYNIVQHSKNLEQFASIVSHNLRAPVANILGLSNVLKSNVSKEDKARSQQFLFRATEQLDDVLKDVVKILQVRSEINEYKEPVNLNELVEVIKSSINNIIEKEMVQIVTDFSATETVTTIKSYIHSIFYNLISNSIKYRKPGVQPVILIKSEVTKSKKIKISFKDNGVGLDLIKYGDKIFRLYQRFHLNIEGKGLGLFMVKTQVETLGGSISIVSTQGEGAEFIIELPQ